MQYSTNALAVVRLMGGRTFAAFQTGERVMNKTRKFRIVRVGDAKRLTKGDGVFNIELNLQPRTSAG